MQRRRVDDPIVVFAFGFVIFAIFVGAMMNASYSLPKHDHAVHDTR